MSQPTTPEPAARLRAGPRRAVPPADTRGIAWGITSLTAGVLAPVLGILSIPLYFLAASGPMMHGAAPREPAGFLLAALLLACLAGLLALAAAVTGIVALRRSPPLTPGRTTGTIGLGCAAFVVLAGLWMWLAVAGQWIWA